MNAIDLFCGMGGWTVAAKNNNINVLYGIDIWNKAVDTYNANNENGICKDLSLYTPDEFSTEYKIDQPLDFIFFSPPCTGFSIAGKRKLDDIRNKLYVYPINYINYFKPKVIVMENVIGIMSMKDENKNLILDDIKNRLSQNYNIQLFKLYASDYGVPQKRRRVLLVGYNKSLNITPTCPDAITNVNVAISTILESNVSKIQVSGLPNYSKLYLSPKAITGIINKKAKMKSQGKGFGANFADLTKPSYTITSRYWKDGYDCLIKYSDTEIRRLTELEIKRVQSFPDDYTMCGTKTDRYIQIGNAVPPVMMTHVIKHILQEIQ